MKKVLVYAATAVLLGAVIMLLPLQIFFMAHGEEGPFVTDAPYLKPLSLSEGWKKMTMETYDHEARTLVYEPADPFVWILAVSFFVSLVVYLIFKKRRPVPHYSYYPMSHP
ncbi:MAG: hypothetical protein ACE5L6_03255 [Candidatus Bathyarchaeia archaeon]